MRSFWKVIGIVWISAIFLAVGACSGDTDDTSNASDTGNDVAQSDTNDGDSGEDASPDTRDTTTTDDTWESYAQGFFDDYCVECHGPSDTNRDYSTFADVERDADTIRCGVATTQLDGCGASPAPEQFPVGTGPKPTDAERERLVEWIDAGMPRE